MSKNNKEIIIIPEKLTIMEDKKSHARSVFFPFNYPDGSHGAIVMVRTKNSNWIPSEHIKSIEVNFV